MISGVPLRTLRAHVSTIYIKRIVKLTTRTEIIRFDGKRTCAFLAVFTGASRCDTVISCSATFALWAYRMMFTCLKIMRTTHHAN